MKVNTLPILTGAHRGLFKKAVGEGGKGWEEGWVEYVGEEEERIGRFGGREGLDIEGRREGLEREGRGEDEEERIGWLGGRGG